MTPAEKLIDIVKAAEPTHPSVVRERYPKSDYAETAVRPHAEWQAARDYLDQLLRGAIKPYEAKQPPGRDS